MVKKKIVEMLVHGVYFETRTESETRRKNDGWEERSEPITKACFHSSAHTSYDLSYT